MTGLARVALALMLLLLGLYIAAAVVIFASQRQLLYSPGRHGPSPETAGFADAGIVMLTPEPAVSLESWYAPAPPGRPTLLFLHGKGGEIADRPKRWAYYRSRRFGVMFLSYRGFGRSTGSPSEAGLIADARAAYDHLTAQRVAPRRIVLIGESLGTGVAVQLAAQVPVGAVALEAPYTAITDIAATRYWWLPVRLLLKDRFDSSRHITAIGAPLLIQHGEADGVVPFAMGEALFAMASEPKRFIAWPGVDHIGLFNEPTWKAEADFSEAIPQ